MPAMTRALYPDLSDTNSISSQSTLVASSTTSVSDLTDTTSISSSISRVASPTTSVSSFTAPTTASSTTSLSKPLPALPTRRSAPRPSCTHLVMDKLFGTEEVCHMCGNIPSIGFIYACQQDSLEHHQPANVPKPRKLLKRRTPNELELLGFNPSVVKAAAAGHYTKEQIKILKAQKKEVAEAIDQAYQEMEDLKARQGVSPVRLADKLATIKLNDQHDGANSHPQAKLSFAKALQACEFRVCHTCRPFSRDRTFVSFESVFRGQVQLPQAWSPEYQPIADADILRNMDYVGDMTSDEEMEEGGAKSPVSEYDTPEMLSDSGSGFDSDDGIKTATAVTIDNGNAFRRSWQQDLQKLLGIRGDIPRDSTTSFNVQLWKNLSAEKLAEAAGTQLPGKESDEDLKEDSRDGQGHLQEKHVAGGLAVMEESVESGSPDIITNV